mgnify:CR=1 FL=1
MVAGSWLGREQRELADSVIRFHVIANSDSEADQARQRNKFYPVFWKISLALSNFVV